MRPGQSFEDPDVAHNYRYRPDYPEELFEKLVSLTKQHNALDLGCGPGKVARRICHAFGSVTAVDPSAAMLAVAQELQLPEVNNINWIHGFAEDCALGSTEFDLIVAAASIHWMDHAKLFPRLLKHVGDEHIFAVVDGDGAYDPPWQKDWDVFLDKWIFEITGERYQPNQKDSAFNKKMARHKEWLHLEGEALFEHTFTQSVDEFIACQFSRDTFARSKLGQRVEEFAAELGRVVGPYSDETGMLEYRVRSNIEWGRIRVS